VIEIGRIRLRLPAGYAPRAAAVARELGAALGALQALGPLTLERLAVRPVALPPGGGDREIGRVLAEQVVRAVRERGG